MFLVLVVLAGKALYGQTYASQDGHLLDANPRQGSMGWNTPMRLDALVPRANLYITGNVGQGASFQGLVPYRSTGEMGAPLGSSTLSNFRRDSVGLTDLSVNLAAPNIYIDPSRAVTGTYGGQVVNTARLYSTPVTPVGANLMMTPYSGDLSMRPLSRSYSSSLRINPISVPDYSTGSPGLPRQPWQSGPVMPTIPGQLPGSEGTGIGEPVRNTNALTSEQTRLRMETETPGYTESTVLPGDTLWQNAEPSGANLRQGAAYDIGEVYSEVLESYRQLPPSGTVPAEGAALNSLQNPSPESKEVSSPSLSGFGSLSMGKDKSLQPNPLQQKQMSEYMKKGEQCMNEGKFYAAANAFDTAVFYDSQNPLPYLAKSHALFAAGELMSSAFFLQKAFGLSKELAQVPVDLQRLFPSREKLDQRMADLQRWEERTGQPMLLFLQGYFQFQLKQYEPAQESLKQAAERLPENPEIQVLLEAVKAAQASGSPAQNSEPAGESEK